MATTFGERLRAARLEAKLTLEKLASEVNSTKSYIWELENKDNARPSADLAYRLADALGILVEDILGHDAPDAEDRVFFRDYKKLKPDTKQQLKAIMKALKDQQRSKD